MNTFIYFTWSISVTYSYDMPCATAQEEEEEEFDGWGKTLFTAAKLCDGVQPQACAHSHNAFGMLSDYCNAVWRSHAEWVQCAGQHVILQCACMLYFHVQLRGQLSVGPAQVLMQLSSRSSKGVPKLVEELFEAFAAGEAGKLVLILVGKHWEK